MRNPGPNMLQKRYHNYVRNINQRSWNRLHQRIHSSCSSKEANLETRRCVQVFFDAFLCHFRWPIPFVLEQNIPTAAVWSANTSGARMNYHINEIFQERCIFEKEAVLASFLSIGESRFFNGKNYQWISPETNICWGGGNW